MFNNNNEDFATGLINLIAKLDKIHNETFSETFKETLKTFNDNAKETPKTFNDNTKETLKTINDHNKEISNLLKNSLTGSTLIESMIGVVISEHNSRKHSQIHVTSVDILVTDMSK